jgi:hypothetical protein
MKTILCSFFILTLISSSFGQQVITAEKKVTNATTTQTAPKFFKGEENVLNFFEPYQADYKMAGNLLGMPIRLFTLSTKITELKDEWEETMNIKLEFLDYFPQNDVDLNEIRDVQMIQNIDLKTGLLKHTRAALSNKPEGNVEINLMEADKIIVKQTVGKKVENQVYVNRDKIYPCTFSNTFLSYLPLDEKFAGSFACIDFQQEPNSNKNDISFFKRNLEVVGSETISIKAGTFDCFKIKDNTESIEYNKDGSLKVKKPKVNKYFDEKKFMAGLFSYMWIDKKTRKLIKAEFTTKYGGVTIELQPQNFRNV